MAVQLAVRAGAEVIGVCGSAHVERAKQLGCSMALAHNGAPWDRVLRDKNKRVDRVLDLVGGKDIEDAGRRLLSRKGIFVTVVGPERFIGDHPLGWMGVVGVLARVGYRIIRSRIFGPRYVITGPGPGGGKALADVATSAEGGVLPPIDSIVPFELAPMREALRRAASHQNNGRIVIQMDGAPA
jgi:NADPH:quinone reductase-like Zn-dependent oxidoreductase